MVIEKAYLDEEEKKKLKLSDNEIKDSLKKQVEFIKIKEKINVEVETEDEVFHLKELIEKGVITNETAKKIVEGEDLDDDIIQDIFNKIDEIEELKDINNLIPKDLRVSKDEYIKAVHDDIFRVQTLTKINSSLTLISSKVNPDGIMGVNIISGFLTVLDKNLVKVQEHTIDIKDSLVNIDMDKGLYKDKRTLLQKILDFFKEIIN